MPTKVKPVVLLILDGWGYSEDTESNAIANARTPVWDHLWEHCPRTLIHTSGAEVGLPSGQMGNSEVGHMNLGAGRVVYQELTRISRSVRTGSFFTNRTFTDAVDATIERGGAVHVLGLMSPGGVHCHEEHMQAMVRLAAQRGCERVYVHGFLDGRDMPPKSAEPSIEAMDQVCAEVGSARIATLGGRFYAMDRDNRWDRVKAMYDAMVLAQSDYHADTAQQALASAYARGESDEFVKPVIIGEPVRIEARDLVMMMNFRADRVRQLTRTLIEPAFDDFDRGDGPVQLPVVCLTEYSKDFDVPVAFPPERLTNMFGAYIASLGLRQLRLAETEKYAHVTYFFNGGVDQPVDGEERILVPSPQVVTYDLCPEMSAREVTDRLVEAIASDRYEAIICNYANADMVGHSGVYEAAVKAIETIDACLGRVLEALEQTAGEMLITADHGNAEMMADPATGQAHTAHTSNPVPLLYVGRPARFVDSGALCDISPTLLQMMSLNQPPEMIGKPLLDFESVEERESSTGTTVRESGPTSVVARRLAS